MKHSNLLKRHEHSRSLDPEAALICYLLLEVCSLVLSASSKRVNRSLYIPVLRIFYFFLLFEYRLFTTLHINYLYQMHYIIFTRLKKVAGVVFTFVHFIMSIYTSGNT